MLSGPVDCDVLVVSNNSAGLGFSDLGCFLLPKKLKAKFKKSLLFI